LPQCYEYHLFGLLRFQNEVSKLIVCFPYSLEAAEEHAYVGTEDGYIALMPIATTGETVLHHAATFDDGDVACALLSYSGAIAVARPFHWFTAVDPLNVVTPNQIATRHSIKRALSPDVSVVVGTAVNDGLALAVKSLRDAESALDDDGASYADIAEAAIASPRMDQDAKRMMYTSMSKAMTYAMLLDPSFVVLSFNSSITGTAMLPLRTALTVPSKTCSIESSHACDARLRRATRHPRMASPRLNMMIGP